MEVRCSARGEMEVGTVVCWAWALEAPAMPLNDSLHSRQADARPLEFVVAMQALENAEQFVVVIRVEACPVISDEKGLLSITLQTANFNAGDFSPARKLKRISQQVTHDLFKQRPVCLAGGQISDAYLYVPVFQFDTHPFQHLPYKAAH